LAFLAKKAPKRTGVTRDALQSAIAEAVRKSDPICGSFIGVVIERATQPGVDSNWTIRGVKFGRADREKCGQALKSIVERMQREFLLSEDGLKSEQDAANFPKQKPSG
jgi:hypothetical protein